MNLSSIDLNLFVVLDAVLSERSATRAAARLHVTQSAVSNALNRLRGVFDDALVTRTRRGLAPTPRALALQSQVAAALAILEGVTRESSRFDLRTTTREWTMAFAEHYGPILLPRLMARLRREAPRAALHVVTLDRLVGTDALATGEVDLHLGIPGKRAPAWRSESLFQDELVCILRKDHPTGRKPLTLDRFVKLPHVEGRVMPNRGRDIDDALAVLRRSRKVVLSVPYFGTIFGVVASSDCIASVPHRQALHYTKTLPLRILKLPLSVPKLDVSLNWHIRVDADPSVIALRAMVHEVLG